MDLYVLMDLCEYRFSSMICRNDSYSLKISGLDAEMRITYLIGKLAEIREPARGEKWYIEFIILLAGIWKLRIGG